MHERGKETRAEFRRRDGRLERSSLLEAELPLSLSTRGVLALPSPSGARPETIGSFSLDHAAHRPSFLGGVHISHLVGSLLPAHDVNPFSVHIDRKTLFKYALGAG